MTIVFVAHRKIPPNCRQMPKIANNSPSPGRPFLRKQESHSVVCHNLANSPTIPRPQVDHSCEGRNLTVSCATIRRIRPQFPVPRKTIPAKAGISKCRVPQFADSPPIPRPQADHSCEGRNLTVSCPTIRRIRPQFPVPPKTIPAKAGIYSLQGGIAALITPPLAAHDCEIPAFAGMVFRGNGNRGRILAGRIADNSATIGRIPPTIPHSPSRPFLRRQESHSVVSHNLPNCRRFSRSVAANCRPHNRQNRQFVPIFPPGWS